MHQGCGKLTARKEQELGGITYMRLNQFKNQYFERDFRRVIIADVFSGSGSNAVGDEIIDGSPIRVLSAYQRANNGNLNIPVGFWFSDIRRDACGLLKKRIDVRFKSMNKLDIVIKEMEAKDAINELGAFIHRKKNAYLYLILDPNGPKNFPKEEVEDLIYGYSKRVDVIPHISAIAINRCIGARKKAKMQFMNWLAQIENFDEGFVASLSDGRKGWIRQPVQGDIWRWTMLPTFGRMPPKQDWNKQGFVKLNSEEGKAAVKFYCGETL